MGKNIFPEFSLSSCYDKFASLLTVSLATRKEDIQERYVSTNVGFFSGLLR